MNALKKIREQVEKSGQNQGFLLFLPLKFDSIVLLIFDSEVC